jgi:hypothetical protein
MGLKHDKYVAFLKEAVYAWAVDSDERIGQSYYNTFRTFYPELEDEIGNTQFDCFNDDNRLPGFLTWVQARLDRLDSD